MIQQEKEFVTAFYSELFERVPEANPLFQNSICNHGRLLMHMLSSIVHSLGWPVHLKMGLRTLGRNHIKYGVKKDFYQILALSGTSLTGTLLFPINYTRNCSKIGLE
jgi:hemoglobin-like flavoprotein